MPITIVVGGQYGSEGKGKVVALLAKHRPLACVVRCGGPNSGHTTSIGARETILRQLPSSVGVSPALVAIAAGAVIDEQVLCREVAEAGIERDRLVIDPRVVIIDELDKSRENSLKESIASTGSGNGQALSRRMLRDGARLVGDSSAISKIARVEHVAPLVHDMTERGLEIVIEGTQGFGLSLLHGPDYPFVTSKDTTASGFAMEVGVSPRDVANVVMVIRTFPIRVGGHSGPLKDEFTWESIQRLSSAPEVEPEYTSVTKTLRRVAPFDTELVKMAAKYNRPTTLAVMGIDRLDHRNRAVTSANALTPVAKDFLHTLHRELGVPIEWVGTGFGTFEACSLSGCELTETSDVR
jgi:adenylosuccinate synthase